MTLHSFDSPDDPHELAHWPEGHIVGDTLGDLIAELCAAHPSDEDRSQMLEQLLGSDMAAVFDGGLMVLTEPQLRSLICWPWVLRELQQRVLLEGGSYWQDLAAQRPFAEARTQIWSRLEPQWADTIVPSPQQQVGEPGGVSPRTRRLRGPGADATRLASVFFASRLRTLVATAALVSFGIGVSLWWSTPTQPAPWGWNRPEVFAQDLPAAAYLRRLADAADEYFAQPRESAAELSHAITDFRRSCDRLLAADHKPLIPDDRAWLRERCAAWSAKFDTQLAELQRTGDFPTVRTAADETVHKLVTALRTRAS